MFYIWFSRNFTFTLKTITIFWHIIIYILSFSLYQVLPLYTLFPWGHFKFITILYFEIRNPSISIEYCFVTSFIFLAPKWKSKHLFIPWISTRNHDKTKHSPKNTNVADFCLGIKICAFSVKITSRVCFMF